MKELLIASTAFALFVICPRMAGMTNIIASATHLSIIRIAVLGTALALPLIILMALIFEEYGAFCGTSLLCRNRSHGCGSRGDTEGEKPKI
ncbi:hypothetical protein DRO03_08615 [Methanosarcinales archaeon]|nr:MAG: hypothetical protein DRO03_08615 [Methanosarcinales archaeon]